jgi:hypothetical protein
MAPIGNVASDNFDHHENDCQHQCKDQLAPNLSKHTAFLQT